MCVCVKLCAEAALLRVGTHLLLSGRTRMATRMTSSILFGSVNKIVSECERVTFCVCERERLCERVCHKHTSEALRPSCLVLKKCVRAREHECKCECVCDECDNVSVRVCECASVRVCVCVRDNVHGLPSKA